MAYDTWGGSWGTSWGLSWNRGDTPPPPPPDTYKGGRGDNPKRKRGIQIPPLGLDFRERKAKKIVEKVAIRQVEQPTLDEHQKKEELIREFEVEQVPFDGRYLLALAEERERLITAEISRLIALNRQRLDDEDIIFLIAASV